jgi:cadherin 5 type 2 (VE-cadherin)
LQIRAYTGPDKFSETNWSQPISTDPDNTAILVGITVPIGKFLMGIRKS